MVGKNAQEGARFLEVLGKEREDDFQSIYKWNSNAELGPSLSVATGKMELSS